MRKEFKILSINISAEKGEQKKPVSKAVLKENFGIIGDAHAGSEKKQVSLLAFELIEKVRKRGLKREFGDFAENITTFGIDVANLPIGTKLYLGKAILEITQLGKEIDHQSKIYKLVGDEGLPKNGAFAKVLKGGEISNESYCYYDI